MAVTDHSICACGVEAKELGGYACTFFILFYVFTCAVLDKARKQGAPASHLRN